MCFSLAIKPDPMMAAFNLLIIDGSPEIIGSGLESSSRREEAHSKKYGNRKLNSAGPLQNLFVVVAAVCDRRDLPAIPCFPRRSQSAATALLQRSQCLITSAATRIR